MKPGGHHSEETKAKISASKRGVPKAEEHKRKIQRSVLRHYALKQARAELGIELASTAGGESRLQAVCAVPS